MQKRRICRENSKYALDEIFYGHFCPRRKAAKFCHPAEWLEYVEMLENVEMFENVEMMELGEINVPFNGAVARRGNLSPLLSVGKLENRNRNIALENKRKPLEKKTEKGGKCDKNGEGSQFYCQLMRCFCGCRLFQNMTKKWKELEISYSI